MLGEGGIIVWAPDSLFFLFPPPNMSSFPRCQVLSELPSGFSVSGSDPRPLMLGPLAPTSRSLLIFVFCRQASSRWPIDSFDACLQNRDFFHSLPPFLPFRELRGAAAANLNLWPCGLSEAPIEMFFFLSVSSRTRVFAPKVSPVRIFPLISLSALRNRHFP